MCCVKMPELQADASRFISSLSKSLQALCHGCMEFDSGIEIVGYININIDSGNKVDYVLNEKVLKSTTNSMTFVSNSFLAKKDQPKQTRDGACSPVPELNQQQQMTVSHRYRGGFRGSHSRSDAPFSHSYVLHGSQKRSWAGMERDWRISPKKQRIPAQEMSPSTSSSSQYSQSHSHMPSTSTQSDTNFKWPQTPVSSSQSDTNNGDGKGQADISIKKEIFDTDSTKSPSEQEQLQTSNQEASAEGISETALKLKDIKRDPDASTPADNETSAVGDSDSTDIKSTFLEPTTSDENQQKLEQSNDFSQSEDNQTPAADNPTSESSSDQNFAGVSMEEAPVDTLSAESETPVEYDEAGDDGAYPQSVYSGEDAGEGASDSGQFEVIEIDDEDEEVQAMFGESRVNDFGRRRKLRRVLKSTQKSSLHSGTLCYQGQSQETEKLQHGELDPDDAEIMQSQRCSVEICSICRTALPLGVTYKQHFSDVHAMETAGASVIGVDPFICELCHKGFVTKERLRQHSSVHDDSYYSCFICDVKFKHKKNIKRHLESTHCLRKCSYCMALFKKGSEFNDHIVNCHGALETQYLNLI